MSGWPGTGRSSTGQPNAHPPRDPLQGDARYAKRLVRQPLSKNDLVLGTDHGAEPQHVHGLPSLQTRCEGKQFRIGEAGAEVVRRATVPLRRGLPTHNLRHELANRCHDLLLATHRPCTNDLELASQMLVCLSFLPDAFHPAGQVEHYPLQLGRVLEAGGEQTQLPEKGAFQLFQQPCLRQCA